jgi:hypothetical protein
MHGGSFYGGDDLGFNFSSLDIEFRIWDGLGSELHGRGKERGHDANKWGQVFNFDIFKFPSLINLLMVE